VRRSLIALASSTLITCGGSSAPPPPVFQPPAGTETINGTERIGWDQPAADAVELASIRYAMYVDGVRSELANVSCTPSTSVARFSCTSPLPPLARGAHALQIASFVVDSAVRESARSPALNVTVTASATSVQPPTGADVRSGSPAAAAGRAGVETLVDRVETPVDLAVAPDGRLFVAERGGRIRIMDAESSSAPPTVSAPRLLSGGRLIALAIDPSFVRTHLIYVLFTMSGASASAARDGRAPAETFTIARLREAGGTLGDLVVLLDRVPASASPAGALRFGPDGKLFAAFDAGGSASASGDPASFNGKVLRLNPDGTTPSDQPRASPVFASDLIAPAGLAWDSAGTLWVADRRSSGPAQLRAVASNAPQAYALPAGAAPTGIAASPAPARDVVVAAEAGGGLLRVRIDDRSGRPLGVEPLLQDGGEAVRALAIAPNGAIVFATANRVVRLTDRRTQHNH
jgi:glucose/arabinose dehydrogenase